MSDICNRLGDDWVKLANELDVPNDDVELIKTEYPNKSSHQAMVMLRLWLRLSGRQATGNNLEQALHRIGRSDIVDKCIFNLELVTDETEKEVAKKQLDQSGFDNLKDELGSSRDVSLIRKSSISSNETIDSKRNLILKNKKKLPFLLLKENICLTENITTESDDIMKPLSTNKTPPQAEPEKTDLSLNQSVNDTDGKWILNFWLTQNFIV